MDASLLSKHDLRSPIAEHLHTDYASVHPDATVAEALTSLRGQQLKSPIMYLYAVEPDGRLVGVVPVRRLLLASGDTPVSDIMVREVVTVSDRASVLEVSEKFWKHRFLALPVVDDAGRMRGVVDVHLFAATIPEPHEREALDSMFQMIGVHVRLGRRVPPWVSFGDRFPWLLANIASGTICALIAGVYEAGIVAVPLIALFLTVVLALAESISMQSMTLTLQSLAAGPVRLANLGGQMGREFATASMLGLGAGLIVGLVVLVWKGTWLAAAAVGGSILGSMLVASALGVFVPTTIRALRADPHVASGPITLASADIVTLLIYFNVTLWLLLP